MRPPAGRQGVQRGEYPQPSGTISAMDNAWIADRLEAFALAARARRREPLHGPRVPARRRHDPRRAGPGRRTSCAPAGCATCAGSARGSRRGCASSSRRGRSPSCRARARARSRPDRARPLPRTGRQARRSSRPRARRPDARGAARGGGGRPAADVPGIGPKTEARLLEALAREHEPRPRRGLLLNRARELVGAVAAPSAARSAGDVRRWRDACEGLAVVAPPRIRSPCWRGSPNCRRSSR